ncbi:hypothetical protein KC19_9G127000 [Ceratodon purpureus]|uniref:Uncharacterized protein n=1 Tax=Ceratodon purpureus TaxID=3225 RepID=A0A8T0GUY3_CERPU|nr:hypothetical protein KC19_9G127000 [Ceratodon purpureus]
MYRASVESLGRLVPTPFRNRPFSNALIVHVQCEPLSIFPISGFSLEDAKKVDLCQIDLCIFSDFSLQESVCC